ncbi:MAG TPA: hypothetical protein VME66_01955 [Candidatus Acidoferrales bacterium]|nr:hypothetical protein [Candidatus Acidoferrales bacterium]
MILLIDVYDWHLRTWDLSLTAGSLFAWNAQVSVAMLLECLATEYCKQRLENVPSNIQFNGSINILCNRKIVSEGVAKALHKIRDNRNNVHLTKMGKIGSNDQDFRVFEGAKRSLHDLETALREHAISIGVLVRDIKPAPEPPVAAEQPRGAFNAAAYVGEYFDNDEDDGYDEYDDDYYLSEREESDMFAEANYAVDGIYLDDLAEEDRDQYQPRYEDVHPSFDS